MGAEAIPASFGNLPAMLADLDGYIERRAQELAAPLIEEARREFSEVRAEIERSLGETSALNQRNEGLLKELRRRLTWREDVALMATETPDSLAAYLAEVRAVASAATEGPWEHPLDNEVTHGYRRAGNTHIADWIAACDAGDGDDVSEEQNHANAEFIAAARTYVDVLLGAVEAVLRIHRPGRVLLLGDLCPRHEAHRHFSITATEAAGVESCTDCTATASDSCAGCDFGIRLDQCSVWAAITRELLSKEDGHA